MYKRDFEGRSGFKTHLARQTTELSEEEKKKKLGQAASVQRSAASPDHSLLQLQRQYGNRYVQRVLALARSAEGDGNVMPDVERAIESSRGGGQSLDSGVKAQMGSALNADFSGVRVHTDAGADGLNQSLSAKAFTTGSDIYFRQGEYNPGSSGGRELLAHELTHVVQQNPDKVQTKPDDDGIQTSCGCGGTAAGPQMKLSVSAPGDQYEQEADRIASAVMHQESQSSAGSSQAQAINRQMPEEEKDKLQGKYRDDMIRRQMPEEEKDKLQGKLQRQTLPEEEEKKMPT
jgi:Domain of unknown function (DUF4157)